MVGLLFGTGAITAARAGRVFGFVLIGLGLLQAIFIPGLGASGWS